MKKLTKEFKGKGEVNGYAFQQIKSTENGFLYKVTSPIGGVHYEVFRRKINKMYDCESYPRAKSFGVWAWTFHTLKKATLKLESL
jgi:hypothetical protein